MSFLRKGTLDTMDYVRVNIIITNTIFNDTPIWSYLSFCKVHKYLTGHHRKTYNLIPINVSI